MAIDLVSGVPCIKHNHCNPLTRQFTGEILYQVDSGSGQWLSRSEFEALTSTVPRTYPTFSGPGPQDFRLFPSDNSAQ
jgi:hypothetical protein